MDDAGVLVIGVGNELRGDDGVGVAVARRVRAMAQRTRVDVRAHQGEPTALLDLWPGYRAVVLVDAMRSGAPVGTIRRFDASRQPLPGRWGGSSSTHAVALDEALELARTLRRLPPTVIVLGVEGEAFATGHGLSPMLEAGLPALADAVLREAGAL